MTIDRNRLKDRFLAYVQVDTTANPDTDEYPSSPGQWELGKLLVEQLQVQSRALRVDRAAVAQLDAWSEAAEVAWGAQAEDQDASHRLLLSELEPLPCQDWYVVLCAPQIPSLGVR